MITLLELNEMSILQNRAVSFRRRKGVVCFCVHSKYTRVGA